MTDLLNDELNLRILDKICFGTGVSVNYSYLSRKFKKHRATIKKEVQNLFSHKIINRPVFPFIGQYKEHPIMIMVYADIPLNEKTEKWIKEDHHIFAAYKVRRGPYNLLLFIFHRSLLRYHLWRKSLTKEGKIPPREQRQPSLAMFFPTHYIIKYNPSGTISIFEDEFEKNGEIIINNLKIKKLTFDILKSLVNGEGIRVNENLLAKKLNTHRKTIKRRIKLMLENNLILPPVCRFPNLFCPPNSMLVISLIEITKEEEEILKYLRKDPHVSVIFEICYGRYNYLVFEAFRNLEERIRWEEKLHKRFKYCFGLNEAIFLAPNMVINIDQQKVSLKLIRKKLELLKINPKEEKWNPFIYKLKFK